MTDLASQPLAGWQNFYVIVGSSGAALIGIQFIVIALVADIRKAAVSADSVSAFATPTVVHLGGALIVSAVMCAPWSSPRGASVALAMCGLSGLGYVTIVTHRAHRQRDYEPVWEDWIWHAVLPCGAYAAFAVGALLLSSTTRTALFVVGGGALGLLLIAIHNAWDAVTHFVVAAARGHATKKE